MAVFGEGNAPGNLSGPTSADCSAKANHFAKQSAATPTYTFAAANTDVLVGIFHDGGAASGDVCSIDARIGVIRDLKVDGTSGGGITYGALLASDSAGRGVVTAPANSIVIGAVAMADSSAANDVIPVRTVFVRCQLS